MKLYIKRGVMKGFIVTILAISVLGVYACVTIVGKIEARNQSLETAQARIAYGERRHVVNYLPASTEAIRDSETSIDIKELTETDADASIMRQVCHNLISGAPKYPGKNEKSAVETGSFPEDNYVCYNVKDNGVGFNMAYLITVLFFLPRQTTIWKKL
jgi:light-regulated signal transduction histidine kinase (bacteriophytochrome)